MAEKEWYYLYALLSVVGRMIKSGPSVSYPNLSCSPEDDRIFGQRQ